MGHDFSFGIEEELFLATSRSRGTPRRATTAFHKEAAKRLKVVEREVLQSQVEIMTEPSTSFEETRRRYAELRTGLAEIGRRHGLKVFAAGTHPTATWREQKRTEKARYQDITDELQIVGRRWVVCGQHVHVAVPRPDARVDMMNRLMPFLPVLLALSTSSPFWAGRRTGLAGYRLRAYEELPRSGLPELFDDAADYERFVRIVTTSGAVADPTFFWWHIRPSEKFPTLELRIADSCTRLEDALTIAALFRCLVRLVDRRSDVNERMTGASRGVVMANLWRAERDGTKATLIDERRQVLVPLTEIVEALLDSIADDATALGCTNECARARIIARDGSSADRQVALFEAALQRGESERVALNGVVDWLAEATADPMA